MYNKQVINPGFAGSQKGACLNLLYRNQWIGLEGAPQTQLFSFNSSLVDQRVGLGLNIIHHTIGITEQWTTDLVYAYRFAIGEGQLGIGLQTSIRFFGANYNDDRLIATDGLSTDGGIPVGDQQKLVPNFGTGIYYNTDRFYVGVSVPRIIRNEIDFNDIDGFAAEEINHYYLMSGYDFDAGNGLRLRPQLIVRYTPNIPVSADINLMATIRELLMVGLTYRTGGDQDGFGESIDALIALRIQERWMLGFSYDMTLSRLKEASNGSIGAVLQVCFGKDEGTDIINPRFF